MPTDVTTRLAQILPGLTHPGYDGTGSIQLPIAVFRAGTTLPPEVAEQFAAEAGLPSADMPKLFAEAIIAAIENMDCEIVPTSELATLRASSTPVEPLRQVEVHCYCGARLFGAQLRDADTDKPRLSGSALITAVRTLSPECALGHRA